MSVNSYFQMYESLLKDVWKESHSKHPNETGMLFEFIDNWIDLIRKDKEHLQISNSISGIILLNYWKLTNWISYEIMSGKYLEALRNLRFIFEGCVYAVIFEDRIESKVFDKYGILSSLEFKTDIFEILDQCKSNRLFKKGKLDTEKVNIIINEFIKKTSLNVNEKKEFNVICLEILSNEDLFYSTSKQIESCCQYLGLSKESADKLKKLWHSLSGLHHFSHHYLRIQLRDPESCFLEKYNKDLFIQSLDLYFQTMDFFYSVLGWRFKILREEIEKMYYWWKKNFNKDFTLTKSVLDHISN